MNEIEPGIKDLLSSSVEIHMLLDKMLNLPRRSKNHDDLKKIQTLNLEVFKILCPIIEKVNI